MGRAFSAQDILYPFPGALPQTGMERAFGLHLTHRWPLNLASQPVAERMDARRGAQPMALPLARVADAADAVAMRKCRYSPRFAH